MGLKRDLTVIIFNKKVMINLSNQKDLQNKVYIFFQLVIYKCLTSSLVPIFIDFLWGL